ncbi:MAG TPA: thioredoxin [Lacibacter sp.]|nr:thioredoxin [Lacibacter sp.]HMO90282.1 thioredoxin [Lacibacter sp.]HMP87134.1 thioredoxin [Lacibacter sp.]
MATFRELIDDEVPVLVDFHATWCGPCKMMAPELEQLKQLMGDRLRIIKIDVDQNQQAAQAYRVSGVPTLILFRKGQILWRQSGVVRARQLADIVRSRTAA